MALKLFGKLPAHPMAVAPATPPVSAPKPTPLPAPSPDASKPVKAAPDVPWSTDTQTTLQALHELAAGRPGVLLIVRNGTGISYTVKSFDPETGIARLSGANKAMLSPRMSERENSMYHPRWR